MDLQKLYTDSDFDSAIVPAGQLLTFNTLEDGKPVTRYKDSNGNFGTLSGSEGSLQESQASYNDDHTSISFSVGELKRPQVVSVLNEGEMIPDEDEDEDLEIDLHWLVAKGAGAVYYKCASVDTANKTWTGYKAVLADGVYSFEISATSGLTYGDGYTPVVGSVYDSSAQVKAYLFTDRFVDEYTVYAASGSRGMIELVSRKPLENSGGTVITDGAFDFAASASVLDFPVSDGSNWHIGDFTMEAVCTPCQPSFLYPTIIATGDSWGNNAAMLRFGNNNYRNAIGYFWHGVGDPVRTGGNIAYSNTEFRHMAICRFGNTVTIYDNGSAVETAPVSTVWNAASGGVIRLGALDTGTAKYVGKIRWARISNIARYTGNFDASALIEQA